MAHPDLSDGFFRFANELAEAFARANLSGSQHRIVLTVARESYGRDQDKGRKRACLSQGGLARMTGLNLRTVRRAVDELSARRIITVDGCDIAIQKDYDLWLAKPPCIRVSKRKQASAGGGQVTPGSTDRIHRGSTDRIDEGQLTLPKKKDSEKRKKEEKGASRLVLPDWLPLEQWEAFLEMRKKKRKPATDYAQKRLIDKLDTFRVQGFSPADVLDQSTVNSWSDIFQSKVVITEAQVETSVKTIPKSHDERSRIERDGELSKALILLAESRGTVLTQARLELYLDDLADLPLSPLLAAIHTWRRQGSPFFPQVPELRAMVAPATDEDAAAEAAWVTLERFLYKHYHPDLGVHGYESGGKHHPPPKLDDRTQLAARACGGYARINDAVKDEWDQSKYGWVKKEFVAAWKRAPAVERHLLTDGEILKQLSGKPLKTF